MKYHWIFQVFQNSNHMLQWCLCLIKNEGFHIESHSLFDFWQNQGIQNVYLIYTSKNTHTEICDWLKTIAVNWLRVIDRKREITTESKCCIRNGMQLLRESHFNRFTKPPSSETLSSWFLPSFFIFFAFHSKYNSRIHESW